MPASMKSVQFRGSLSLGGYDDDQPSGDSQLGSQHPVHQGVSEVTPWMASTAGTVASTTAWRSRKGAGSMPQPYTARNAGSVFKFTE